MKKTLFWILIALLVISVGNWADWYYNPETGTIDYYEPVSGSVLGDLGDITFTGTARGDIIYRGAAAWLNLAGGTAGQALIMGANDPAWGTLGQVYGGTGIDTSGITNGQLLIGNTTGNVFALASITGTAGQITVTLGASSITLSTPQSIGTGSDVQFADIYHTDFIGTDYYNIGNSGASITIDWNNGNIQFITLTAVGVDITFTEPPHPGKCELHIIQDGTGNRTIDWEHEISPKWPGDVEPTLSTAADAVDVVAFTFIGGTTYRGLFNGDFR